MNAVDENLRRRTWQLLQPGDIDLNGAIVPTDLGSDEEAEMHQRTVDIGEIIAEHVAPDAETWVYSGNDDPEFGANQHQGLTTDEEFVWECQQLLREGTFDLVFYYPAGIDQAALVADLRAADHGAVGVRGDRPLADQDTEVRPGGE